MNGRRVLVVRLGLHGRPYTETERPMTYYARVLSVPPEQVGTRAESAFPVVAACPHHHTLARTALECGRSLARERIRT